MAAPATPGRLRITTRSALVAVALFGLTLVVLRVAVAAQRVLGWVFVAAAVAGLLEPLVRRASRRLPRGVAVLAVVFGSALTLGVVGYGLVDALVSETERLQRAAPAAAERIEQEGQFAKLARQVRLADRTERFLEQLPERLRGGTPAEAVRAATTRAVAFLATGVLSIFFLLHGASLASGAARQLRLSEVRTRVERVASAVLHRGFGYARGNIAMSAAAGLTSYAVARIADVPGPAPLAFWVALWDLVPLIGFAVGALPIVVLSGVGHTGRGITVALFFALYQVLEAVMVQRRLERRTVRLGPFLTVAGGLAGLELYGIGGALGTILILALVVVALDELAPPEDELPTPVTSPSG